MAEYLPLHKPGQAETLTASATIVGGQLVMVSGSGTVAPATAASTAWYGVAGHNAASGEAVVVYSGGTQRLTASGAITAGAPVVAGAAGTVAAGTTVNQVVGIARTTAADGAVVEIKMAR